MHIYISFYNLFNLYSDRENEPPKPSVPTWMRGYKSHGAKALAVMDITGS